MASATTEGTRYRERPRKRWRDKVKEDLNVMRTKKRRWQWPETVVSGGRLYRRRGTRLTEGLQKRKQLTT
jgi:hypothetical protein